MAAPERHIGMSCFIIAEAGVNHNGELDLARRLVDVAAAAGADAVKFQTFRAEQLVTSAGSKAPYQTRTTGAGSQIDMLRALELAPEFHEPLAQHARERGIGFASTPFDIGSVDFLDAFRMPFLKSPSGEITNYPLLRHIAAKRQPVILSTGMSTLAEVRRAVEWLGDGPCASDTLPALTVLHCVTAYPAPASALNLRCIGMLAQALGLPTGYSDHSFGIEMPIAAVALGARIVEKHFTLDRALDGPDHAASLEPQELRDMVRALRDVEAALGDGVKKPAPCEAENIAPVRKSIVARRAICVGETLDENCLDTKRPEDGISAARWPEIVGRRAKRNFAKDEPIEI
jgi:N,N'-diacetyllegionaminate synthase